MFQISSLSVSKCFQWSFSMVQISGKNSKLFWSICPRRITKIHPSLPSPPFSKDEGLKDMGHSMSIGNLILGVNSVTVLYFIRHDSLLQNATDIITKCDSYFITKCDRFFITKYDSFYKIRRFYYKMRQLLQNTATLFQNATVITKCDVYYKLRQYTCSHYKLRQIALFSTTDFQWNKYWYPQNTRGISRDLHIFWVFLS